MKTAAQITSELIATMGQPTRKAEGEQPLPDRPEFELPEGFVVDTAETRWMLDEVQNWFRDPSIKWLSLLGTSMVGKTTLAREVAKQGNIRFRKWSRIIEVLRNGQWEAKGILASVPSLVIDDLGASHETQFSKALADELADRRIGKRTIWTSNWTLEQIGENLSHRVRTRMRREENRVVEIVKTKPWCDR